MPLGGYAPLPLRLGVDYDTASHARTAADLSAIVRTQPLCRITYTPGATVTIQNYVGMNGSGIASAPTPTFNGAGDVTFTFPASFVDDYGVELGISIRYARVTAHYDAGAICKAAARAITRNTVRVLTYVIGTGLGRNTKTTLTVY